jgi:hypothetical protein
MPTFDTPEPISATIDVVFGDVRISAGDRSATVVDVRPSDLSNEEDIRAAERTRVEYANEQLVVKAPKLRSWSPRSAGGSIDVTIELPAGSHVRGAGQLTDFRCDGRLGDCRIRTGVGHIQLDCADTARLKGGIGDISVDRATGDAEVTTASGDVRMRELDAGAVIKTSNGDTWVGVAGGDLRVKAATAASRSTWRTRVSSPNAPTATSGWVRRCAARSSSRPGSATSRSASARARPPGSTFALPPARSTTRSTPPRLPSRRPRSSRCARARPPAAS